MAAAGHINVGDPYEECFADELIKMARAHYTRQGARTMKAVKVAQMGRIMAQREAELSKEAISLGGISNLLRGAGSALARGGGAAARGAGAAARGVGSAARSVGQRVGQIKMPSFGRGAANVAKAPAANVRGAVAQGAKDFPIAQPKASTPAFQRPPPKTVVQPRGPAGTVQQPPATQALGRQATAAGPAPAARTPSAPIAGESKNIQAARMMAEARGTSPTDAYADMLGQMYPHMAGGGAARSAAGSVATGAATPAARAAGRVSGTAATGAVAPPTGAMTGAATPKAVGGAGAVAPQAAPAAGSVAAEATGAAAGAAPKQPGFLRRFFGGAREGFGASDLGQLGEAGRLTMVGRQVGDVASGALGMGSSTMKNIAGQAVIAPAAARAGQALLGAGKRMLGSRGVVRSVAKAGKGAIGDVAQAATHAPSLGREALEAAVGKGMSGQQLAAAEQLFQQGGNLSRGARKKLERMAGMSYDSIAQSGSLSNAVMQASPVAGAGRVAREATEQTAKAGRRGAGEIISEGAQTGAEQLLQGGGEEAAGAAAPGVMGRVKSFLNRPLGGPKTRLALGAAGVALPVVGGLGLYGAYHGMNRLAQQGQQTQYQHGAYGLPVNYSPTAMFPAGQVYY